MRIGVVESSDVHLLSPVKAEGDESDLVDERRCWSWECVLLVLQVPGFALESYRSWTLTFSDLLRPSQTFSLAW